MYFVGKLRVKEKTDRCRNIENDVVVGPNVNGDRDIARSVALAALNTQFPAVKICPRMIVNGEITFCRKRRRGRAKQRPITVSGVGFERLACAAQDALSQRLQFSAYWRIPESCGPVARSRRRPFTCRRRGRLRNRRNAQKQKSREKKTQLYSCHYFRDSLYSNEFGKRESKETRGLERN